MVEYGKREIKHIWREKENIERMLSYLMWKELERGRE